jgi:hypothetical protein
MDTDYSQRGARGEAAGQAQPPPTEHWVQVQDVTLLREARVFGAFLRHAEVSCCGLPVPRIIIILVAVLAVVDVQGAIAPAARVRNFAIEYLLNQDRIANIVDRTYTIAPWLQYVDTHVSHQLILESTAM